MRHRRWITGGLVALAGVGALLTLCAVGGMEAAAPGENLYPYIAKAFVGLMLSGLAVLIQNWRDAGWK